MLVPLIAALLPSLVAAQELAPPADPLWAARERAVVTLEAAVERVRTQDLAPTAALTILRAAGDVAARELGEQRAGALIEAAVLDARWRATVDAPAALADLERALAGLADDLAFRPIMEAEQPPGFPDPTPLHEIRLVRYPGYRLAYAEMAGPRDGLAFFKLFRHIQSNEIAMTAPVEVTFDSSRMEQTRMAFLYEGPTQGELGPDGAVEVVDVPPTEVVSIGFRGNDSNARVAELHGLLSAWVEARADLELAGAPRTMGFNSPRVRGERRFFEVQVPVRRVEREAPNGDVREL